jgi:hypothetical protein
MIKKIALALFPAIALVACGDDDSGSGTIDFEDSFEMVLNKASYEYDDEDSTFKLIKPVCKVERPGNLMGPEDVDEWDTTTYKAREKKGFITLTHDKEELKFVLDKDGSFPTGLWTWDIEGNGSKNIYDAVRLEKNGLLKSVIRYDGVCLMKDFYSQLSKENAAISDMENSFVNFYKLFLQNDKAYSERDMLSDVRAVDCDELSLFSGLLSLKVSDFNESSGTISVGFEERTCDIMFQMRYAYDQDDCEEAYEDFRNDRDAAKEFDFDKYSFDVTYDGDNGAYCLDYLVVQLKEEKGIPTRRTGLKTKDFARGIVNLVIGGLK